MSTIGKNHAVRVDMEPSKNVLKIAGERAHCYEAAEAIDQRLEESVDMEVDLGPLQHYDNARTPLGSQIISKIAEKTFSIIETESNGQKVFPHT